jgi:Ca-activated chloride channel family protein
MGMRRNQIIGVGGGLVLLLAACTGDSSDHEAADSRVATGGDAQADTYVGGAGNTDPDLPAFADYGVNPAVGTAEDNVSTFALDVDTGSYAISRNYVNQGFLPPPEAVRTEEFVNYFPQDYEAPADGIGIHVDGTAVPFLDDPSHRVLRVGLQAATVADGNRKPAVLTFVVDTSGSMADANKLDMVGQALNRLVDALRPDDRIGIVTYSDTAVVRLEPTPVEQDGEIRAVIDELVPQESTNADAGLRLGYEQARASLDEDAINRVVLLSDGVANVDDTDPTSLAAGIQEAAGDGIQLVTVGVGMGTYNDVLMEQLADDGDGFYAYVDSLQEAERLFVHDLTGTLQVVARDAKVQVTFDPTAVSKYRLLGFENRQLEDDQLTDDTVDGGEVGAGHTVTALYEVTLPEGGVDDASVLATIDVHWIHPDTGEPADRTASLSLSELASSFDRAPERLRQDILVAAFAEHLRDAPWSEAVDVGTVADNAEALERSLDDEVFAEFAQLTRIAANLSG